MKTLTVAVQLSGKKIPVGSPSMGKLMLKKLGPVKLLEDFPGVYQSSGLVKVKKFSQCLDEMCNHVSN